MVRTAITRGNGASTGYSYDAISRLTSLSQTLTGTSQSWTFAYNAQSQINSKTSSNTAFDYNGAYAVMRPYANNGLNQMTVSGSNSLTYDLRGNLTSDGVNSYTYNSVNQLLTRSGGGTASLTYDPLGRLASTIGASTTQFAYSGDQLLSEYDGSGALLRRYVPGALAADDPIVWYEGAAVNASTRRWLIDDYQGSVVGASDGTGALISGSSPNTYDEYGVPGAANQGRYQYTGQIWIPELGLYHYKARTYSPTLGRFLETDPIGYADDLDLYAYVGDDPVDKTDPLGLKMTCKPVTTTTSDGTEVTNTNCTSDPDPQPSMIGLIGRTIAHAFGAPNANAADRSKPQNNQNQNNQQDQKPKTCPFGMHPAVSAAVVGSAAAVAVEAPIATAHALTLAGEVAAGAEAGAEVGGAATVETGPGLVAGAGVGALVGGAAGGMFYLAEKLSGCTY